MEDEKRVNKPVMLRRWTGVEGVSAQLVIAGLGAERDNSSQFRIITKPTVLLYIRVNILTIILLFNATARQRNEHEKRAFTVPPWTE